MKTLIVEKKMIYDGTQLKPLYNYLEYGLLGDSVVCWTGPCSISFEHMIDGEDILSQSEIRGNNMVHFIVELFQTSLAAAVGFQRLMSELAVATIKELQGHSEVFIRKGDDIYWQGKKLNISIATVCSNSSLIHWALNVTNEGTPVPTCCLNDFKIDPHLFAEYFCEKIAAEWEDIIEATQKIRPL